MTGFRFAEAAVLSVFLRRKPGGRFSDEPKARRGQEYCSKENLTVRMFSSICLEFSVVSGRMILIVSQLSGIKKEISGN